MPRRGSTPPAPARLASPANPRPTTPPGGFRPPIRRRAGNPPKRASRGVEAHKRAHGHAMNGRRGSNKERAVAANLRVDGWIVYRSAGSHGNADLIALKHGYAPRLLQV